MFEPLLGQEVEVRRRQRVLVTEKTGSFVELFLVRWWHSTWAGLNSKRAECCLTTAKEAFLGHDQTLIYKGQLGF